MYHEGLFSSLFSPINLFISVLMSESCIYYYLLLFVMVWWFYFYLRITNSPIADVFVVWARSDRDQGAVRGFILEKVGGREERERVAEIVGEEGEEVQE